MSNPRLYLDNLQTSENITVLTSQPKNERQPTEIVNRHPDYRSSQTFAIADTKQHSSQLNLGYLEEKLFVREQTANLKQVYGETKT